jgi:hypothetical protein
MYYNPFSDEPVLICRNAAVVNRKEGVREEVGEIGNGGTGRANDCRGREEHNGGATSWKTERQTRACLQAAACSVRRLRSLAHHSSDHQIKANKKKRKGLVFSISLFPTAGFSLFLTGLWSVRRCAGVVR